MRQVVGGALRAIGILIAFLVGTPIALGCSALPIAGVVILTLFLVHAGPFERSPDDRGDSSGPSRQDSALKVHVDQKYGYRFEYPASWKFVRINEMEVAVSPRLDGYVDQVRFSASPGPPSLPTLGQARYAAVFEASHKQVFALDRKCRDLMTVINEPRYDQWTWMITFTVICDDRPLQGVTLVKETPTITFIAALIQASLDFPEGLEVVRSLRLAGGTP